MRLFSSEWRKEGPLVFIHVNSSVLYKYSRGFDVVNGREEEILVVTLRLGYMVL